jgi:ATP synthase protein I
MFAPLNPGRQIGRKFLKIQFILIAITTLIVGIFGGFYAAVSAFLGGFIGWLANAYVVFRVFRHEGARNSTRILRSFFVAEGYKIGISALGLGLMFWSQKFVAAAVFIGYIASLTAYWSFPFISEKTTKQKANKYEE